MSEKLIVFFHDANDRFGLEDGLVLHAQGEHFESIADRHEGFAAQFPIQETVPGGARLMVWEGERQRERQWDTDDDPYFVGTWRPATAIDLIDADLLGGLE